VSEEIRGLVRAWERERQDVLSPRTDHDPQLGFVVAESEPVDELAYIFFVCRHCLDWEHPWR
jgi:hypothetical protein